MKYVSPYLAFFVMGAVDVIAPALPRIRSECAISGFAAGAMPFMMFAWFLFLSVPSAVLCGRLGRRRSAALAVLATAASLSLPAVMPASSQWTWIALFSTLGAANVLLQVAMPGFLSEIFPGRMYASALTAGYFVKMSVGVAAPLAALAASRLFGDWKFMLAAYALAAAAAFVCLTFGGGGECNRESAPRVTFAGCFRLLACPYISAMVAGIALAVGADVVFSVAVPGFMMDAFGSGLDAAAAAPAVFYGGKIAGMALCAVLLARIPAHRMFPWMMGLAVAGALCLAFAPGAVSFLVLAAAVALGTSNTMSVCVALAYERHPRDKDAIAALLMMAISGGGIVPLLEIPARRWFGPGAAIWIMSGCLVYLFVFGMHACREARKNEKAKSSS